jgi:hypothetical protein
MSTAIGCGHQGKKRWAWSAARVAVRAWGEDTPFEPESSRRDNEEEDEDREEGR